jgi:hypothetical protein
MMKKTLKYALLLAGLTSLNVEANVGNASQHFEMDSVTIRNTLNSANQVKGSFKAQHYWAIDNDSKNSANICSPIDLPYSSNIIDNLISLTNHGSLDPRVPAGNHLTMNDYLISASRADNTYPGIELSQIISSTSVAAPEPETYTILLSGIGLLAASTRRRYK